VFNLDNPDSIGITVQSPNFEYKITPSVVTTLAGNSTASFADGTGTAARFGFPNDVAVDASGHVYVADRSNFRVRKISPTGVVTTLAGDGVEGYIDGTGSAARFSYVWVLPRIFQEPCTLQMTVTIR
jgi:hypothetical protein